MFGYIVINKAEMKFKDFDIYHAYYCGLCRVLKKQYGMIGQLTLSYDMTFLLLLLSGLYEPEDTDMHVTCTAHPFHKHAARVNAFTSYAADMNLILSYYKCIDDWKDERKKKAYINTRLLHTKIKKIEARYPRKTTVIAKRLRQLSACEKKMTGIWITWPGSLAELWQKSLHTGRMNGNLLFGNSDFFLENSFI